MREIKLGPVRFTVDFQAGFREVPNAYKAELLKQVKGSYQDTSKPVEGMDETDRFYIQRDLFNAIDGISNTLPDRVKRSYAGLQVGRFRLGHLEPKAHHG